MNEDRRREIGLFRYALVRDAADVALSKAERGRLVRALAEREHVGPDGRLVRVARGTLDRWIRAYRRGGFEALVPRPRVVCSCLHPMKLHKGPIPQSSRAVRFHPSETPALALR
jgi:hypothetical protein